MDDHDRLRDLSSEDAEDLRAFLEKRKWFEQKLSVLEAAEPLHPFIHPILEAPPDGAGYQRVGEAEARWQLPVVERLKAWQKERDELEEEILAFDGGDLGRMKEKTRAITLIPLTKPSTELVEITLVLILVIDKLLTLLRRRGDVLELTRTRLKWDDLRWRFRLESEKLQPDIDAFLRERAAWTHDSALKDTSRVDLGSETPGTDVDLDGSRVIPKTPVRAKVRHDGPAASLSATTPTKHADLFASFTRSPSLDFARLSPLHRSPGPIATPGPSTTITGFRVRQKQIASLAERSGQLLDRMIDQATPLADLGDTSGPSETGAASGAVPEKLLDLQDDLEVQVASLEARIGLCKTVVKHQEATDAFLRLCAESETDAQTAFERLRSALKGRPSRDDRDELSALLLRASKTLPGPVDSSTLDAFRHPEYPQLANTGMTMQSRITDARRSASDALLDAREAMAYAAKAFDAWSAISALEADMAQSVVSIRALSASLAQAMPSSERSKELPLAVMGLCDEADGLISQAEDQLHRFGIAVHRLHHTLSAPPPSLASEANDLNRSFYGEDLDAQFETLQAESRVLRDLVESAKTAQIVDPPIRRANDGLNRIGDGVRRLELRLCDNIDTAAFGTTTTTTTAMSETSPNDLRRQHRELVAQFQGEIVAAMAAIEAAPRSSYLADLQPDLADLRMRADACRVHLAAARHLCNLLDAVKQQAEAVVVAQREADEILRKITSLSGVSAAEPAALQLRDEVDDWSTGLAVRVRLVSDLRPSSPKPAIGGSADRPRPQTDLNALDRRVRAHVNELSARVLAAAQSLMHGNDEAATDGEDVSDRSIDEDALDGVSSDNDSIPPDSPTKMASRLPAPTRIPSLQRSAPRTSSVAASSSRSAVSAERSSPRTTQDLSDDSDMDGQGRLRTVSDTPTRSRSAIPRASLGNGLVGGQYATVREDRNSRASLPNAMQVADPARRSHGLKSAAKRRVLKTYISNEKSELDVAVGSIINNLKVDIPIVPVGMNEADEWTDQSGKYWIGTEGRAKLCFCRILRSKTVMVRVGGGWVELSKFLLDHFADAFWQSATDSMAPATPARAAGGGSLPSAGPSNDLLRSTTAMTPAPSTPASRIPMAIGLGTPRTGSSRTPLPALQAGAGDSGPVMPETPSHGLIPTTPGGSAALPLGLIRSPSINGASSPLVPLQFLRKASESPPVREKEKEKFTSPRRSILERDSAPPSPTKPVIRAP